jgi:hypothetical protein
MLYSSLALSHLKDALPARLVWHAEADLAVKAAGAPQRRVQIIGPAVCSRGAEMAELCARKESHRSDFEIVPV